MSMEIKGRYDQYPMDHAERLKAGQEKAEQAPKVQTKDKAPDKIPDQQDEYISSERSGAKPSGLYRVGQDENGRRKVFYDDPKKSAEKCTGNTDQVDREIEKLKEKKKELEQQIRLASGDERKVKELESRLAQVESELSQKDNDTYRRQHATFSGQ